SSRRDCPFLSSLLDFFRSVLRLPHSPRDADFCPLSAARRTDVLVLGFSAFDKSGPGLRWPSRLVATAAERRLNFRRDLHFSAAAPIAETIAIYEYTLRRPSTAHVFAHVGSAVVVY